MAERNRQEQRAARERMKITGENYTTALRAVREEKVKTENDVGTQDRER